MGPGRPLAEEGSESVEQVHAGGEWNPSSGPAYGPRPLSTQTQPQRGEPEPDTSALQHVHSLVSHRLPTLSLCMHAQHKKIKGGKKRTCLAAAGAFKSCRVVKAAENSFFSFNIKLYHLAFQDDRVFRKTTGGLQRQFWKRRKPKNKRKTWVMNRIQDLIVLFWQKGWIYLGQ